MFHVSWLAARAAGEARIGLNPAFQVCGGGVEDPGHRRQVAVVLWHPGTELTAGHSMRRGGQLVDGAQRPSGGGPCPGGVQEQPGGAGDQLGDGEGPQGAVDAAEGQGLVVDRAGGHADPDDQLDVTVNAYALAGRGAGLGQLTQPGWYLLGSKPRRGQDPGAASDMTLEPRVISTPDLLTPANSCACRGRSGSSGASSRWTAAAEARAWRIPVCLRTSMR